jgi:hypothetical protein
MEFNSTCSMIGKLVKRSSSLSLQQLFNSYHHTTCNYYFYNPHTRKGHSSSKATYMYLSSIPWQNACAGSWFLNLRWTNLNGAHGIITFTG